MGGLGEVTGAVCKIGVVALVVLVALMTTLTGPFVLVLRFL